MVEASPNDAIWGIGMAEDQARVTPPEKWKGLNLLGKALTRVRNELDGTSSLSPDLPPQARKFDLPPENYSGSEEDSV